MDLSERLAYLADVRPDADALHIVGLDRTDRVSRRQLHGAVEDGALALGSAGAAAGSVVLVPTGNDLDSVVRILSSFRAGLVPVVLDRDQAEDAVLRTLSGFMPEGGEVLAYRSLSEPVVRRTHLGLGPAVESRTRRDQRDHRPAYYLCTSGTTGAPKTTLQWRSPHYSPRTVPNALLKAGGWVTGQRQLICNPIYHAGPFVALLEGIMDGNLNVIATSDEGAAAFSIAVDRGCTWWQATPQQMADALAADPVPGRRLHRLQALFHGVFPCPQELKREWIGALGPRRVLEWYGSTEGYGYTFVDGEEWLRRPGTVGRGLLTRIAIIDGSGRPLPAGRQGSVHMRRLGATLVRDGAAAMPGFRSVGDRGYLDSDGFLFLTGREPEVGKSPLAGSVAGTFVT